MLIFSPEVVGPPLRTFVNQTEPNPSPRARERRQAQMTATSGLAAGAGLEVLIQNSCRHPSSVGNDECRDAAKMKVPTSVPQLALGRPGRLAVPEGDGLAERPGTGWAP